MRYRTTPRHVDAVLARRPNAKGAANLRAVMSGEARVSLSRLESRFLELLREHGLPLPQTNRPAGGRRVDCRWPDAASARPTRAATSSGATRAMCSSSPAR